MSPGWPGTEPTGFGRRHSMPRQHPGGASTCPEHPVGDALWKRRHRLCKVGDKGSCRQDQGAPMLWSSRRGSGYRIRRLHQVFRYRTGGLAPPARAAVPSGHFCAPESRKGADERARGSLAAERRARSAPARPPGPPDPALHARCRPRRRGASAVLRCVETYRYDTTETTTGADGRTDLAHGDPDGARRDPPHRLRAAGSRTNGRRPAAAVGPGPGGARPWTGHLRGRGAALRLDARGEGRPADEGSTSGWRRSCTWPSRPPC